MSENQFPYDTPPGISVYKPKGATKRTRWHVAYRPDPQSARKVERVSPSAETTRRRIREIERIIDEGSRNPGSSRITLHNQTLIVGLDDGMAISGSEPARKKHRTGHLFDYYRVLLNEGSTPDHALQVYRRARRIFTIARINRLSEIVPSAVLNAIAGLQDDRAPGGGVAAPKGICIDCGRPQDRSNKGRCGRCQKRKQEGKPPAPIVAVEVGPRTRNHYLRAVKQFTAWLAGPEKRSAEDLLKHLSAWNVDVDERHPRQDLGDEKSAALLEAARKGATVCGMSGIDRSWLYEASLETGFRANELRTLTPRRCLLDDQHPILKIIAAYSKHRREDEQPIRHAFAARFAGYLAGRPMDEPIWNVPAEPVDLMKVDLAAAGIPYVDEEGRFADFHCLRHTFICRLVRAGVLPKECQVLARHSSIVLTMDYYTHLKIHDTARAIAKVGNLPSPKRPPEALKATGTDAVSAQRNAQRASVPQSPLVTTMFGASGRTRSEAMNANSLKDMDIRSERGSHLAGLEPATFGSVASPSHNVSSDLSTVTRAARRSGSAGRSAPTADQLQRAINRINDVLKIAGGKASA